MMWSVISNVLSWLAIAAAFVSAYLWYQASKVTVKKDDPRSRGGFLTGTKDGTQVDVYSTVLEGSKLNERAAIATGIAALLGALSAVAAKLG
jgi:hypothetical protein